MLDEILVGEGGRRCRCARSLGCGSAGAADATPVPPPAGPTVRATRVHGIDASGRFPSCASVEALDEELARDDRVIFFGEDVAIAGGVFAVTPGLYEKYGRDASVRHADLGARARRGGLRGSDLGLRPVVEIMFGDFLTS